MPLYFCSLLLSLYFNLLTIFLQFLFPALFDLLCIYFFVLCLAFFCAFLNVSLLNFLLYLFCALSSLCLVDFFQFSSYLCLCLLVTLSLFNLIFFHCFFVCLCIRLVSFLTCLFSHLSLSIFYSLFSLLILFLPGRASSHFFFSCQNPTHVSTCLSAFYLPVLPPTSSQAVLLHLLCMLPWCDFNANSKWNTNGSGSLCRETHEERDLKTEWVLGSEWLPFFWFPKWRSITIYHSCRESLCV